MMPAMADPETSLPAEPGPTPLDLSVHEAFGPALTGLQAGAAIGVGVNSLLVLGVLPVLLGALADQGRLTAAGIGLTAMIEILCMGLSTGAMGLARRPGRLRLVGAAASLGLAALDLAAIGRSGVPLMALRGAAGAAEGVLLWITVGMIARTVTPERWAGVFFTAQTLAQLLLALALALIIAPRFGADGVFVSLALCSLLGVVPAALGPSAYAVLPVIPEQTGTLPARGWLSLAATLIYVAAPGAVAVYLQPLAQEAGLDAGVARTAVWVSLVAQVAGGALATVLAGRLRYFAVFVVASAAYLAMFGLFGGRQPGWLFIAANALGGLVTLFLAPFLVPFMIEADPSRRSAMQSGAAQLLGGALGPFLASLAVGGREVRGVLWLGAVLLLLGLAGVAALRFTARRAPLAPQAPPVL
jgi:hypothetical protein